MIIQHIIQGNLNKVLLKWRLLPEYIKEQAEVRAEKCSDCLKAGKCSQCGCYTPQLFLAPNKKCKLGKWDTMVSKDEWIKLKDEDEN